MKKNSVDFRTTTDESNPDAGYMRMRADGDGVISIRTPGGTSWALGQTGPTGPTGPTGEGQTGPTGPTGPSNEGLDLLEATMYGGLV